MTPLLEEPARDAVTLQNYERKALRKALTLRITLRKVHFAALMFEITDSYNERNASAIRQGLKDSMIPDTAGCRALAPQRLRHDFTNYDDIWTELEHEVQSEHVHQIVYCRTMRIIKDAYPELTWLVERDVNRKYPLETRLPVCMPTSFEDVVRDVKRIESERREVELKEGKEGYGELTDKALKAAVIEHILNTQTYLNEQRPAVLMAVPAEERSAKAEQLRQETLNIVYLAYPELGQMGKPSTTTRLSKAAVAPPANLNRRVNLAKAPKGDTQAWVNHLTTVLKKQITPLVAPRLPAEQAANTPPRKKPSAGEVEEFLLKPIAFTDLLAKTVNQFNAAPNSPRKLDLNQEDMREEIFRRAIMSLLTTRSNYAKLHAAVKQMKPEERETSRRNLETSVHNLISRTYPQLTTASEDEMTRRISGKKFVVPKQTKEPSPTLVPAVELVALPLDGLFQETVQAYPKRSLVIGGDAEQSRELHMYAVRLLAGAIQQVTPMPVRSQAVNQVTIMHPELQRAVDGELMLLTSQDMALRLNSEKSSPTDEHVIVLAYPIAEVRNEAVENYNRRVLAAEEEWLSGASLLDMEKDMATNQDQIDSLTVGWIFRYYVNFTFIRSMVPQADRHVWRRLCYEAIRKTYPELSNAIDHEITIRCPEPTE